MMLRPLHWLTFIVLFLHAGCGDDAITPVSSPAPAILDAAIRAEMARDAIPSIAAAIVKDDRIVWQNTYGHIDAATQSAPTGETIYILASISKTITATAVMQIYEKGLIDLDADISTYLPFEIRNPHFPEVPITTKILLTHRSGLAWPNGEDPNFYRLYHLDGAPGLFPWVQEYLVPGGSEYVASMWKNTRPGSIIQYSNMGGALLGYLVEAVTGQDFGEYCKKNIFEPLAMRNTGFRLRDVDESMLADVYTGASSTRPHYSVRFYPSTTVRSSIEAFSHFVIAMMNGGVYDGVRILREETVDEMLSLKYATPGLAFIWWSQGNNWVGHTGGFWGVSSSMDINRANKVGVIILCNQSGKNSVYPGGRIYDLLHQEAEKFF